MRPFPLTSLNRARLLVAALSALAVASVGGAASLYLLSRDLPDVATLTLRPPHQTTEIWSSDGVLLARLFDEHRKVVPLDGIPKRLQQATLAIEDHRFFEHSGVDWRGILRALHTDIRGLHLAEGGSTITQQLVRNVWLTREKTVSRKVKEAIQAVRVEQQYSKPDILAMYLNQVYYGNRSFGVEAASRTYFGKPVSGLTLAECATLAGIPQRPAWLNPFTRPEAVVRRRNLVLQRMVETGMLSLAEGDRAARQPLRLAYAGTRHLRVRHAPWFVDHVLKELVRNYSEEGAYGGGYRVVTTLNWQVQQAAERALNASMARRFGSVPAQAALVSVEPSTGAIRAMVGGRDYWKSPFNRATQARRQPGSTFKAFVYAAALAEGARTTDRIQDSPVYYADHQWKPRNLDLRYHGDVTLREAFANSYNIPAVRLCERVGPEAVAEVARACGIRSPLRATLSLALGTSEVTPLEMASAYGAFAFGGSHVPAIAIKSVAEPDGTVIFRAQTRPEYAVDARVAARVDSLLRNAVLNGTGRGAAGVPEARGKTGTTDNHYDVWFVGYTLRLSTAVWAGYDRPRPMPEATGGGVCVPIWASFMRSALPYLKAPAPASPPPSPSAVPLPSTAQGPAAEPPASSERGGLRICTETGLIASPECRSVVTRRFRPGAEPLSICPSHAAAMAPADVRVEELSPPDASETDTSIAVCLDSGLLARPGCLRTATRRLPAGQELPPDCDRHR